MKTKDDALRKVRNASPGLGSGGPGEDEEIFDARVGHDSLPGTETEGSAKPSVASESDTNEALPQPDERVGG